MTDALSADQVRADIAEQLYLSPEELVDDTNLLDSGLDSVRILGLVERWREAGAQVSFIDLVERPTFADWTALLSSGRPGAADV
jgi:bifunctional isochorismate lyase/aryl carrier protein